MFIRRLFSVHIVIMQVSASSSQGIVQSSAIENMLRKRYRVEAVLPQSRYEWTIIWRRHRWFWQSKD